MSTPSPEKSSPPHHVAIIDDGDDIFAIFVTSPFVRAIMEEEFGVFGFEAGPAGTLVAAAKLCTECVQRLCDDLRDAGLVVDFRPLLH
jgi:hypothetical protein